MRDRSLKGLLLFVMLALTACESPVPTTLTLSQSTVEFDAVGGTVALTAQVLDQDGQALPSARVTWTSASPSVAQVSSTGSVIAAGNGTTLIRAEAGAASATATVVVRQRPASLVSDTGGGQEGVVGDPLPLPLSVLVRDRLGAPAEGIVIRFEVAEGGGDLEPGVTATGFDGRASATWTLGERAGEPQVVTASVSEGAGEGLGQVRFEAAARAGPPFELRREGGDGQSFRRMGTLPDSIRVRLLDRFENPIDATPLSFSVKVGGGAVEHSNRVTDIDGRAATRWTLGAELGPQRLEVTAPGLSPVPLTALALAIPDTLRFIGGIGVSATVGTAVPDPPAVLVLDAGGLPVPSAAVTFTIASGGGTLLPSGAADAAGPQRSSISTASQGAASLVVMTDAAGRAAVGGWVLGTAAGSQSVQAEVDELPPKSLTATAIAGPTTALTIVGGNGQSGVVSTVLTFAPTVVARDEHGNPVSGERIEFAPLPGMGVASPARVQTGSDGRAATSWFLGPDVGQQQLLARVEGTTIEVTFLATAMAGGGGAGGGGAGGGGGGAGFHIELLFTRPVDAATEAVFQAAAARWEGIISAKLPDVPPFLIGAGACGNPEATTLGVDDLAIFVTIEEIDGPLGILGSAGPCYVRDGSLLPVVGRIRLDAADVARLHGDGRLASVVLHEMGHVLGIGTLWTFRGLLQNPSLPSSRGADTHFTGGSAVAAFDQVGGTAYVAGAKVPVENSEGGQGTRDAHWRISVFGSELMVGFLGAASPLSRVSIASLADLGYSVDEGAADPYSLGIALPDRAPGEGGPIELGDDIWRGPIGVLGPGGGVVRVVNAPDALRER